MKYFIACLLLIINFAIYAAPNKNFIAFTDIHFDPFYACESYSSPCALTVKLMQADVRDWDKIFQQYNPQQKSYYGSDTNYGLLVSSLNALQQQRQQHDAQFGFVLGDFLAHDFERKYRWYSGDYSMLQYPAFVKKVMQFLVLEMQQHLPVITLYPVLGNNDSDAGDYQSDSPSFLRDFANAWQPLVINQALQTSFAQQVSKAGYYSLEPEASNKLRIIVLNSSLFTPQANDVAAANLQMQWLAQQLQQAQTQQQKVWLVMHIPPGINVFRTARVPLHRVISFWMPAITENFLALLQNYSKDIVGILSSHTHMDSFMLIGKQHPIIDSSVPALSPIFGNNPGFKIYSYDSASDEWSNYLTYYLALNAEHANWQLEYDFNKVYESHCLQCTLLQGMQQLTANSPLANNYKHYYSVSHSGIQLIDKGSWQPYYWCAIHSVTEDSYKSCVQSFKP